MVPRLPTSLHSLESPDKINPPQKADFLRHSVAHSIIVLTVNPWTGLNNLQLSMGVSCFLNCPATSYVVRFCSLGICEF